MHICIHGAGALGSLVGGYIALSGDDTVTLVGRRAHATAIQERGLCIDGIRGSYCVRENLRAVTTIEEVESSIDVYILCVKAAGSDVALREVAPLADRVGLALSLQNTVTKDEALARTFGAAKTIGASTIEGANLVEAGIVHHTATCPVTAYFGELDGGLSDRVEATRAVFERAGFASEAVSSITQVEWEKLLQIATVAGWSVSTLAARRSALISDGLSIRAGAEHYVELARELLGVYRSLGYEPQDYYAPYSRFRELLTQDFEQAVASAIAQGARMEAQGLKGRASMHEDVLAGRRTEVDWIIRPFLDQAARAGIAVPVTLAVYRTIKTLDALT